MAKCLLIAEPAFRYIPIPKTASSSITSTIFDLGDSADQVHRDRPVPKMWGPDGPPTFTCVRDPFDRFASTWRNKVHRPHRKNTNLILHGARPGMSFRAFTNWVIERKAWRFDPHIRPQISFLSHRREIIPDLIVMDFEKLSEDWDRFGFLAAFGPLKHINATEQEDPYTPELREQVAAIYHRDIDLLRGLIR